MMGQLSSLTGSCLWLIIATFFRVPVSGTHGIVGATIGFAIVAKGFHGINWIKLILIVSSWFISPVLSAAVSIGLFFLFDKLILSKKDHLEPGLRLLPIIYSLAININSFSVFWKGPQILGFDKIPFWGCCILSFGLGNIVCLIMKFFYVPYERKRILGQIEKEYVVKEIPLMHVGNDTLIIADTILEESPEDMAINSTTELAKLENARQLIRDTPEQVKLFSALQVLTAIFGSFAHGGNDVSNAIAPLIGIWVSACNQHIMEKADTPIWILLYGGLGISVGLWIWGRGVIQTLGEDLTRITPSSGVCIELGSALTVLVASNLGIPISTTHCKVGSVVGVGRFRSKDNVNWGVFRNIIVAWCVTLPACVLFTAVIMWALMSAAL